MSRRVPLLALLLLGPVGAGALACAGGGGGAAGAALEPAPPRPQLRTFAYDCEGMLVVAHFEKARELKLFLPNRAVRLPRAPSGSGAGSGSDSGARYSDGDLGFFAATPREAVLERAGEAPLRCVENRSRSLRADAKLRGVVFRGVGNEPGWLLEIGPDHILFERARGRDRAAFPLTEPRVYPQRQRTVYHTSRGNTWLTIAIARQRCRDAKTGETFGSAVAVRLDERVYRGCGDMLK